MLKNGRKVFLFIQSEWQNLIANWCSPAQLASMNYCQNFLPLIRAKCVHFWTIYLISGCFNWNYGMIGLVKVAIFNPNPCCIPFKRMELIKGPHLRSKNLIVRTQLFSKIPISVKKCPPWNSPLWSLCAWLLPLEFRKFRKVRENREMAKLIN
jgi:hypothetical protein